MAKKKPTASSTPRKRNRRRRSVSTSDEMVQPPHVEQTAKRIAAEKANFIERLKKRLGILMYAAEDIKKSRRTIELWRKADHEFNEQVHEVLAKQRAVVEQKLMEKVLEGDMKAITFYLRCKGRERDVPEAWREMYQHQLTGDEKAPIHTQSNVSVTEQRTRVQDDALTQSLAAAMRVCPHLFEGLTTEGDA
jgi:hypothetical protein